MTDPLEIQLLPDMDTVVLVFQHQTMIGFSEITVNKSQIFLVIHQKLSCSLWQYRLWSFQGRDTKLERFLAKIIEV